MILSTGCQSLKWEPKRLDSVEFPKILFSAANHNETNISATDQRHTKLWFSRALMGQTANGPWFLQG
jgi:hypothetical protein